MKPTWRTGLLVSLVPAVAVLLPGCFGAHERERQAKEQAAEKSEQAVAAKNGQEKKAHDHSGWWCDEHGIPEAECIACSAKLTAEAKRKGDWCDKHDRAKSQCFLCDPKLKEKYAAKYRAKYGKEPPPIEEEEETKETKN